MAEYSKEYREATNSLSSGYDFSYLDEFQEMENGFAYFEICEGLGTIGIVKLDNKPYLIFANNSTIEYYQYILSFKK